MDYKDFDLRIQSKSIRGTWFAAGILAHVEADAHGDLLTGNL